jgi:hypothetical protein
VDSNELRRLAAEVDEEHRLAMRDLRDQVAAEVTDADDAQRASRRAFLRRVGVGGALVGSVPFLAGRAGAQTTTTAPQAVPISAVEATTTTAPPRQPTQDDLALYVFAQSLELAAVEAYGAAAATGLISDAVLPVALAFRSHHLEHANAFVGLARRALGQPNPAILEVFGPQIAAAANEEELLSIAFNLENAAAATYIAALGQIEGTRGAEVVASIQPIESRHAVVLGQVLGLDAAEYLPAFQTTDDALDPDDFPSEG